MRKFFFFTFFLVGAWFFLKPQAVQAAPTLTQNAYRFYVNADATAPTDPWPVGGTDLGENTAITTSDVPPKPNDVLRLRMSIAVSGENQGTGLVLKLQYGQGGTCSAIGTWIDVGGLGSSEIWRGYDNATPADGALLLTTLLAASDVAQTYEEANNSASSPSLILIGQDGEWDFVIQNNGATQGTSYCFRLVQSDGTALNGYTNYPKLTTYPYTPKGQNWRLYDDENNATPSNALAPENTRPIGIRDLNIMKLRYTIKETNGFTGENVKMKLQFSTTADFSSDVNDVMEIGSCTGASKWCYADGANVADNDSVATRVLSDSTASATHNESGASTSTYSHSASTASEWEFTIKNSGATSGTVYYFRAFEKTGNRAVPLDTGKTYPQLKVFNTILSFTVAGIGLGVTTEGITTTKASTATSLPFGTLIPNLPEILAQRLTVTADGVDYKVSILSDGALRTVGGETIVGINATNDLPGVWGFDLELQKGVFGYHAGDDTLSAGSTRFQGNDTWAKLETTAKEVAYSSVPVENDVTDIVFKVQVSALQPAGTYANEIIYVVVPTY